MPSKRSNNEGSIYKRKDGCWCAQVRLSGQCITEYAKSQRECYNRIREIPNKIQEDMIFDVTRITNLS